MCDVAGGRCWALKGHKSKRRTRGSAGFKSVGVRPARTGSQSYHRWETEQGHQRECVPVPTAAVCCRFQTGVAGQRGEHGRPICLTGK